MNRRACDLPIICFSLLFSGHSSFYMILEKHIVLVTEAPSRGTLGSVLTSAAFLRKLTSFKDEGGDGRLG